VIHIPQEILSGSTLPLASSSDFTGLIIFAIVAILSALSKKIGKQEQQKTLPQMPSRRVPPQTSQTPPQMGTPDLAVEMRKYLEGIQKKQEAAKSTQTRSAPAQRTPPQRAPAQIQKLKEPPPIPVSVVAENPPAKEMLGGDLMTGIQQEIQSSMRALTDDVQITKGELSQSSQVEAKIELPRFDTAALRNPQNVRQAVIFAEILGQPRALTL
jgi:hypothetical protein